MSVKLVNDGQAILSMRESDFDAYSAYGEVIDNSIQAGKDDGSKVNVKVKVTEADGGRASYKVVKSIAFGDDGSGMDVKGLEDFFRLGDSSKIEQPLSPIKSSPSLHDYAHGDYRLYCYRTLLYLPVHCNWFEIFTFIASTSIIEANPLFQEF